MWPRLSLYRLSKAESKPSRAWAWALKYQSWCMINLTRSRLWDMYPLSLYFKNHKWIQATVPLTRHHVSPELCCRAAYLSAGALSTNLARDGRRSKHTRLGHHTTRVRVKLIIADIIFFSSKCQWYLTNGLGITGTGNGLHVDAFPFLVPTWMIEP